MKKVIIGALVLAVVINIIIVALLYQKKIIFQPTNTYQSIPAQIQNAVATAGSIGQVEKVTGTFTLLRDKKYVNAVGSANVSPGDVLQLRNDSRAKLAITGLGAILVSDNTVLQIKDASHLQVSIGQLKLDISSPVTITAFTNELQATAGSMIVWVQPQQTKLYVQTGQVVIKGATVVAGQEATITASETKVAPVSSPPSWIL